MLGTTYIGLAIADGMFSDSASAVKTKISPEQVKDFIDAGVTSGCNPSHKSTIDALALRFGIVVPIPEEAPFVKLVAGDKIIVLSARFSRRLNEGEVWNQEDVDKAEFKFSLWTVTA